MNLRFIRLNTFYALATPFGVWARKRRMRWYTKLMNIKSGMSVLDLGGQPMIWHSVPASLKLTILNLPGIATKNVPSHHEIIYIEGDACCVAFSDRAFDTIFCNSVIEHVGPRKKQIELAREIQRLGKSYWVQTPSKWFPIDPHSGMPFWWFYPPKVRFWFIDRWRAKLPVWTKMVEETTVLSKDDLIQLFPEAAIIVEKLFFIPKSYIAYYVDK